MHRQAPMQIEAVLRRQEGVISREQAIAAGLSTGQIDRRLASGLWLRVHPRVYLAADRNHTDEARVWAAELWAGEPATVSGLSADWWYQAWPDPPAVPEITVPTRRRLRAPPGVRLRRRDLAELDRVGVRGLWVTDLPLTVLEAAIALGERGSEPMDRAPQRRVGFEALRRAYHRNLGRSGSGTAGRLLAAAADRAA